MGMDNDRVSHAIFGAIVSFEVRLAICDRLISLQKIPEEDKELWRRMSYKLRGLYKKRHGVAHFTIHAKNAEISPFLTMDKLRTGEGLSTLNIDQVMERATKFIDMRDALKWFGPYVILTRTGRQEGRLKELEEPRLIPHFRELAAQSLAKRKGRDQAPQT